MKIAVIYNRQSNKVINLFGLPSREKYGLTSIQRIVGALRKGGHQVMAFEGDKDLIPNLEGFMPKALKGELPGMAFNLSYGIQGQARYTHVPGILEMVGIPYVGSGPLGHSLALDKVVAKMLFVQNHVPTPEYAVFEDSTFEVPNLPFPLIVKPKNEAVSFGLRIVHNESELRDAVAIIHREFEQAVLVERYIDGREINVGLIGNGAPEAFPVAELIFGEGPRIYTEADKKAKGGSTRVSLECPAKIPADLASHAQSMAIRAFKTLGLYDCARVDMRVDPEGNLYVLEINSLPSLGQNGSYMRGAAEAGLDFTALVNRLVDEASARYFGTPTPNRVATSGKGDLFAYITERRDRIEKRIQQQVARSSRTQDPIGVRALADDMGERLVELGLRAREDLSDGRTTWSFETGSSMRGGTLVIASLDVPLARDAPATGFRRDPEWLCGEGIAVSRAPLASLEFAIRSLRARRLKKLHLGVLLYGDEGQDCQSSADFIRKASQEAAEVIVLRPGNPGDLAVASRRGQRRFRLRIEGSPRRLGASGHKHDAMLWLMAKAQDLCALSSRKQRVSVDVVNIHVSTFPMWVPHRVDATVVMSYPDFALGDTLEARIRELLGNDDRWSFEALSDRPPMPEREANLRLIDAIRTIADDWHIPFGSEWSVLPSVAGLVPAHVPVVCGLGPVGRDLYTGQEAVSRVSVIQRTLLLAGLLAAMAEREGSSVHA